MIPAAINILSNPTLIVFLLYYGSHPSSSGRCHHHRLGPGRVGVNFNLAVDRPIEINDEGGYYEVRCPSAKALRYAASLAEDETVAFSG